MIELMPKQAAFVNHAGPFVVLDGLRGAGKTVAMIHRAFRLATDNSTHGLFISAHLRAGDLAKEVGYGAVAKPILGEVHFPNGSVIFVSRDGTQERFRGYRFDWVAIDNPPPGFRLSPWIRASAIFGTAGDAPVPAGTPWFSLSHPLESPFLSPAHKRQMAGV